MTLNEYQQAALRTAPQNQTSQEDLIHGILGIITELGEYADPTKKNLYYGKPIDKINKKEEIGDLMWYVAILCRAEDVDMDSVAVANINKLKARYPDKFYQNKAINRDLAAERKILES